MIGADMLPLLEAEARKRQAAAGGAKSPQTDRALEGKTPQPTRAPQSRDHAAALVGTSGREVGRAKRVIEFDKAQGSDLSEKVRQGTITLKDAEAEVRRREAQERATAERQAEIDAIVNELGAGETIVVNMRDDISKVLEAKGLLVRIDRGTPWGNPFILDDDGDRETVIASYADHYLPHKPSLLCRLDSLRGKALGCWCAPLPCHGDALKELIV
jgi:hypothetical protein